ncbi:hypothetical protein WKT22_05368 [Candidatus Lokiarchaeum ossiferum]
MEKSLSAVNVAKNGDDKNKLDSNIYHSFFSIRLKILNEINVQIYDK